MLRISGVIRQLLFHGLEGVLLHVVELHLVFLLDLFAVIVRLHDRRPRALVFLQLERLEGTLVEPLLGLRACRQLIEHVVEQLLQHSHQRTDVLVAYIAVSSLVLLRGHARQRRVLESTQHRLDTLPYHLDCVFLLLRLFFAGIQRLLLLLHLFFKAFFVVFG